MDIRKIKKLIEMLEKSDVAEIEIREGEDSVRISRHTAQTTPSAVAYPGYPPFAPMMPSVPQANMMPESTADSKAEPTVEEQQGDLITSPMVGTFYRAASPTSKPFVEEGHSINEGDTLCIIEAMKILNQITAEKAGVIKKVLVENGSPVEYGEPLFIIE